MARPRCPESHARILEATNRLLEAMPVSELQIEQIAARAKVGKQTIYRWWGGKRALVMEALLATLQEQVFAADTGSVRRDLSQFLERSGAALREPSTSRTLASLMAEAQADEAFARQFRERFLQLRRDALFEVLERGVRRGQLSRGLDLDLFIDVVFGAYWYRLLTRRAPIDKKFARQVVELVLPRSALGLAA